MNNKNDEFMRMQLRDWAWVIGTMVGVGLLWTGGYLLIAHWSDAVSRTSI
jgi:hypothetical protein